VIIAAISPSALTGLVMISKAWRFLTTPPGTYEPGWRLTPRWVMRVLRTYVIAALCSGLLFVICTALLALFLPSSRPTHMP
jgi:hypothetical protein